MEKAEVLKQDSDFPTVSLDKPSPVRHENIHSHSKLTKAEEIAQIDALATADGVTLASFKHLDEKKILRKMDLRLIQIGRAHV